MTDHKAHVAPIVENAARLLADAKILLEAKSFRTATALAVLAIEEVGKACLVYWKLHGFDFLTNDQIIKATHIQKQRVLSAYYFYKESTPILDAAAEKITPEQLIHQMMETPPSKYFPVEAAVKTGSFDTVKQLGFYLDLNDDLKPFSITSQMGERDAVQQIKEAEVALTILDEGERAHFFISLLYEQHLSDGFKGNYAKIRRDIMRDHEAQLTAPEA
ncbi:AbiV family abortive infection protein [Rhizobium leguminosarum]|uniref:AbiV family abortive infection protein n=1 Tax=Rhizobium leguminosarum TaxID=384 RepID=UPI001C97E0AB|nr:AbiV family abortive infection protein [Rhizobium leguminosarum]MBY5698385.1 AbiV family abortive infection protein [Rhizobium leguminosarum]